MSEHTHGVHPTDCDACAELEQQAPITCVAASGIPSELSIEGYLHCAHCLDEYQDDWPFSRGEYAQLQVGFTAHGLQVWCKRHRINVMHVDFQGHTHPANSERSTPEPADPPDPELAAKMEEDAKMFGLEKMTTNLLALVTYLLPPGDVRDTIERLVRLRRGSK